MTAFFATIAGVLGAVVGSFLNVVIHRVPRGMSLRHPPSSCPSCGQAIRPRDNVPVLGYVVLRGRCHSCRARISPRYPLVELATAALWVGAVLRFGPFEEAAFVAAAAGVLVALAGIDLEHRRLPNAIVLPSIGASAAWVLGVGISLGSWSVVVRALACGAALFAVLLLIALVSGGMGFGDVKLAAFIGIVTGRFSAGVALAALLCAFVLGGLAALALLATGKRGRKDPVPFGPALGAGALVALFLGVGPVRTWLGL